MKEVTYEEWQKNPTPRMMWVWDGMDGKVRRKVLYYNKENKRQPVIALSYDEKGCITFQHCAEIEKTRRMTNQELAWWLREKPTREWKWKDGNSVCSVYGYEEKCADEEVDVDMRIREDDGEWREPLVEVEE